MPRRSKPPDLVHDLHHVFLHIPTWLCLPAAHRADALCRLQPNPAPFRSHFAAQPTADVLKFPNLGGDAMLVVPAPLAEATCYTHLGRFLRSEPRSQVNSFWRCVGTTMQERLSIQPT